MDRSGHQVLARPGLARDQDGDIHPSSMLDDVAHLAHLGTAPERQFLLEPRAGIVRRPPRPQVERIVDSILEVLGGKRFPNYMLRGEGESP